MNCNLAKGEYCQILYNYFSCRIWFDTNFNWRLILWLTIF